MLANQLKGVKGALTASVFTQSHMHSIGLQCSSCTTTQISFHQTSSTVRPGPGFILLHTH